MNYRGGDGTNTCSIAVLATVTLATIPTIEAALAIAIADTTEMVASRVPLIDTSGGDRIMIARTPTTLKTLFHL